MLSSLPFDAMMFDAHANHASRAAHDVPPNGAPLDIMLIRVAASTPYDRVVPSGLSAIPELTEPPARRVFTLDHAKGLWRINRSTYRMTQTAFAVRRGAREVWEFRNPAPGMPHPVHVHGFQYRVLERRGSPPHVRRLAVNEHGVMADRVRLERQRARVARRNPSGSRWISLTRIRATRFTCSSATTWSTRRTA